MNEEVGVYHQGPRFQTSGWWLERCMVGVKDDGILTSEVVHQVLVISIVLFADSRDASFDDSGFVEDHIISHRPCPLA